MTLFFASIVLGIVPMVLYAFVVWRIDHWEKEPLPLLVAAFCWGALPAIVFSIIAQTVLELPYYGPSEAAPFMLQVYQASLVAPVTEEIIKGLGLVILFIWFGREVNSVLDGLIFGSMIGFGFAAVENIFYFWGQQTPEQLMVLFVLRSIVFGMQHAFYTGLAGVGFALGRFSRNRVLRIVWPLIGVSFAIVTHALHNYFCTLGDGEHLIYAVLGGMSGFVWFVFTVVFCLRHERKWIEFHLADEVKIGVLYAEQALDTARFWTRSGLSALTKGLSSQRKRKKLFHEATELAFEKQRQLRFGASDECHRRIADLRETVQRLSREDPLVVSGEIKPGRVLPPPLPPTRRVPPTVG